MRHFALVVMFMLGVVGTAAASSWEVPDGGSQQIITNNVTPRDIRLHNDGPDTSIKVKVTNHSTGALVSDTSLPECTDVSVGIRAGEDMTVYDPGADSDHDGATGTWQS